MALMPSLALSGIGLAGLAKALKKRRTKRRSGGSALAREGGSTRRGFHQLSIGSTVVG